MSTGMSVGPGWSDRIEDVNVGVEEFSNLLNLANKTVNTLVDCEGLIDSINSSQDKPVDPSGPVDYYSLRQAMEDIVKKAARLRENLSEMKREIGAL